MNALFSLLFVMLVTGFVQAEEERPLLYPFDVVLGGEKAEMGDWGDLFAVVKKPVKADALLEIDEVSATLIVNAFPCKEDGTILMNGAPAAIIFVNEAKEVRLDATMDQKKLEAGTYLMNVVAHGTTSRVVFTVTDGKAELKLPDFKKLADFLRGK